MATKRNILVFIHGMITGTTPTTHQPRYEQFFQRLGARKPQLQTAFSERIYVEWGHETPSTGPVLRPDEKLMKAQNTVHSWVNFRDVSQIRDPNNKVTRDLSLMFMLRGVFTAVKEQTFMFGLSDAVYYSSEDGESAVREAVYGQVLQKLEPFKNDDVHLHVISHSLGVTVAFDFLYGLFAPSTQWAAGQPDFASNAAFGAKYMAWRAKQQSNELHLGSTTSMASQLPLLLLRKQKVVDILSGQQKLDPTVIGVPVTGPVRWKFFYDRDDILGFPSRNLFQANTTIADIQVDTADRPDEAHDKYWENDRVVEEVADLLAATV